jgi:hypothetical protein
MEEVGSLLAESASGLSELLHGVGRAAEKSLISGCGPGTRATCSAVLSGALEAYPPLGTPAHGVPGARLVAGYRI